MVNTSIAAAGQNIPRFWGAQSSSPILPASRFSTTGCPFEVGPFRFAPRQHMVVGAPGSYVTPRASTPGTYESAFKLNAILIQTRLSV
jgi:hypothetical protein